MYFSFCFQVPSDVRFFRRGGMTAKNFDRNLLQQLTSFQPDYVLMNIGGNDIRSDSVPRLIVEDIVELIEELEKFDIKVIFCDICERGKFPKDSLLTKKSFNAQGRKINALTKNEVQTMQVNMRFPKDYDQDKVHLSNPEGMKKFFYFFQRYMLSLNKVK